MGLKLDLSIGFNDSVYLITKGNTIYKTMGVTEIRITEDGIYYKCGLSGFLEKEIGKTVFTNRNDAEIALIELLKIKE